MQQHERYVHPRSSAPTLHITNDDLSIQHNYYERPRHRPLRDIPHLQGGSKRYPDLSEQQQTLSQDDGYYHCPWFQLEPPGSVSEGLSSLQIHLIDSDHNLQKHEHVSQMTLR